LEQFSQSYVYICVILTLVEELHDALNRELIATSSPVCFEAPISYGTLRVLFKGELGWWYIPAPACASPCDLGLSAPQANIFVGVLVFDVLFPVSVWGFSW